MKKIIAWILLGALLLGFVAMAVAAEEQEHYRVGYAKVDINPYDESTTDPYDLLAIPMAGNGFSEQRLSYEGKLDDNGDGVVDDKDGLFATCVAITDKNGNTLLQFAYDVIGPSPLIVNPVRQQLSAMFPELTPDRIMFNGSHTHSGPDLSNAWKSGYEFSEAYVSYVERFISQMVLAGEMAMEDRTPATMYKGQIEANDSKASKGDIGDTLNESLPAGKKVTVLKGEDYPNRLYNAVRHYMVSSQPAKRAPSNGKPTNDLTLSDGTSFPRYPYYAYTRPYQADPLAPFTSYVGGDNFNGVAEQGQETTQWYYVDKNGNQVTESYYVQNAESGNAFWKADVSIVRKVDHVSETDDTMQILEFRFAEKYNKKPIVLVNWRAHTTMNRMVSDDFDELAAQGKYQDLGFYSSYYQMSGDWANALRYVLERNGYRPLFLQGAAGNINGGSRLMSESGWMKYETETDRTHVINHGNIYGSELAEVALECLREHMVQINKDGGDIKNVQVKFQTERKEVSVFEYLAGLDYRARYTPAVPLGNESYSNQYYYTDANGEILVDKDTGKLKVDENGKALKDAAGNTYTDDKGNPVVGVKKYTSKETFIITSIHHANSVANRYASNGKKSATLELNAIMIGNEFAVVTAPNELFDRYSDTATQYDMSDNLWTILDDFSKGSYGEPFIAGYSNGHNSYLPSRATYSFSSDNPKYATGSYETLTSQYAPGNGEEVIRTFKKMLDYLNDPAAQNPSTYPGYCDHCKKSVTWTELTTQTGGLVLPNIKSGHYYLPKAATLDTKQTMIGANVCLDLNGNTLAVKNGLTVTAGSTLSIVGKGIVAGIDAPANGGVFTVEEGGTLNLYEATVRYAGPTDRNGPITNGGILHISGTFNMYGGTVQGTTIYWTGGAAYVAASGRMNLYGGKVLEASTGRDAYVGDCIFNRGTVMLSGDAQVDDLYFKYNTEEGGPAQSDALILSGVYTGRVNLTFPSSYKNLDIGNSEKSDYSTADITVNGSTNYFPIPDGTDLICKNRPPMLAVSDTEGVLFGSSSYATVFTGRAENERVVLLKDMTHETLPWSVPNTATLDLNGHNFWLPKSGVPSGRTLYVMDSATADYDISDGVYGKFTIGSGKIAGAPATEDRDVYLMIQEPKAEEETVNTYSFHAIGLNMKSMSLNPDNGGLYFTNDFRADTAATAQIQSFGVALDIYGQPTEQTLSTTTKATRYDAADFGKESTSTLVTGILKNGNTVPANLRNANRPIYGSAYVQLQDGSYLFGHCAQRSLTQQLTATDDRWESLDEIQQTYIGKLYRSYAPTLQELQLPAIRAASVTGEKTGWQEVSGSKLYYTASGDSVTGLQTIDGVTYYFSATGEMLVGIQAIDGDLYGFNQTTGAMLTGWQTVDGDRYYFSAQGKAATGLTTIRGQLHQFSETGVWEKEIKKPQISKQLASVAVANGKSLTASFTAVGEGLTYQWYYKNAGDKDFTLTTSFTGTSYTTTMNPDRHDRQIYCVVTDAYGQTVKTAKATISIAAPKITKQPASVTVAKGATASTTVTATGEGLTYTWYVQNPGASTFVKSSVTKSTYSYAMDAAKSGRNVYCVITDTYGRSVTTNTVTMKMK